jgi:rhodanese-related sulfurtransferase
VQTKRRKSIIEVEKSNPRPLQRCHSESEAIIKSALNRNDEEQDLIGDFSKPFCLPLIPGKHQDLKSITPETVAKLLRNEYSHIVEKFLIIDCRYPYEYEGGHIRGAKNIYTREGIMEEFIKSAVHHQPTTPGKRNIIIFHCEFSSERAPNLSRFLRNKDREANSSMYPSLHFPEVYLLDGGYKNFFYSQKDECQPQTYKPMMHEAHSNDLKHFRQKSKSWAGEKSGRSSMRSGLKYV